MPVDHVNGAELYWERRGSGPRLLFCNGSGTTMQTVRPLLDVVAAKFDLLAWDYRGLGRSVPLTGPYTMADLAADAVGLLEIARVGHLPGAWRELRRHGGAGVRRHQSGAGRASRSGLYLSRWRRRVFLSAAQAAGAPA